MPVRDQFVRFVELDRQKFRQLAVIAESPFANLLSNEQIRSQDCLANQHVGHDLVRTCVRRLNFSASHFFTLRVTPARCLLLISKLRRPPIPPTEAIAYEKNVHL